MTSNYRCCAAAAAARRGARRAPLLAGCAPLLVGGAVVGGAMVATDRRTSGAQVDDETIEVKARQRACARPSATAATSTSPATTGMVLLTGEVPTEADKAAVEQVVARVDNVRSVVNELAVGALNTFADAALQRHLSSPSKVKASLRRRQGPVRQRVQGRRPSAASST